MSYLPRLSKTYKEPQESFYEELEESASFNRLKPASSLLNEKTFNPQMILRHYKYLPHAPPVLPGPSVLEELRELELYREASKMRRSSSKVKPPAEELEFVPKELPKEEESESGVTETDSKIIIDEKRKRSHGRKSISRKSSSGRKKSGKSVKKGSQSKLPMSPVLGGRAESVDIEGKPGKATGDSGTLAGNEVSSVREPSQDMEEKEKPFELASRSVQCTIFGSISRIFIVPPVVNSLLRILAFLLREMNREETAGNVPPEKKSFINQIQLILGDLCSQKTEKEYGFDVTYSDFKRLEKIQSELQRYMKAVYGDKGEYIDKMDDLRKIFIELKKKEMELSFLRDKLQEMEEKAISEVLVKEVDLKNSEITLQNKRLESEQLAAEAEFSCRELRQCQKSIAEVEWEIRDFQEQIVNLKKTAASKSKTGMLTRKSSILKFSQDSAGVRSRSRESETTYKKKT